MTSPPCVLLVDDHPENLLALESLLKDLDVDLVRANSGPEALNDDFALILLEIQMPGMDGYETATLIRSRVPSSRTPIMFVNGEVRQDYAGRCARTRRELSADQQPGDTRAAKKPNRSRSRRFACTPNRQRTSDMEEGNMNAWSQANRQCYVK